MGYIPVHSHTNLKIELTGALEARNGRVHTKAPMRGYGHKDLSILHKYARRDCHSSTSLSGKYTKSSELIARKIQNNRAILKQNMKLVRTILEHTWYLFLFIPRRLCHETRRRKNTVYVWCHQYIYWYISRKIFDRGYSRGTTTTLSRKLRAICVPTLN